MEETTRLYELGYLLIPTISESDIQTHVDALSKIVTDLGGTVTTATIPEYIDLAYTMEQRIASKLSKWSQAYFGSMKFELAPAQTDALKKALDGTAELIRYLLIKTDADNMTIFKKPALAAKRATEEETLVDEAAIAAVHKEEAEANAQEEGENEDGAVAPHELLPDVAADIAPDTAQDIPEGETE